MLYKVTNNEAHDEEAIDRDILQFLSRNRSSGFAYCVQVHAACSIYASYSQLPTLTWASDDFMALRLPGGSIFSLNSLKKLVQDLYLSAEELLRDLCFQAAVPTHFARNLKDDYSVKTAGYGFLTDKANLLPSDYLWIALQRDSNARGQYIRNGRVVVRAALQYMQKSTNLLERLFLLMHVTYGSPARMTEIDTWKHVNSVHAVRNLYCHPRGLIFLGQYNKTTSLTGMKRFIVHLVPARLEKLMLQYLIYVRPMERIFAAAYYKAPNHILKCYQQYLFTGYRGRFGAERLRRVVLQQTERSLHAPLNVQELRQALVAFLDKHVGHADAENILTQDLAHDMQAGHSSRMATMQYAVGTQDIPMANRYDVHLFMTVSERWIKLLGEELPLDGLKQSGLLHEPSRSGQSVEGPVASTIVSGQGDTVTTTITREITEIYTEASNARVLPVAPETFQLLHELRGPGATFRTREQAAAIQAVISNPGDSHLVILPTGSGKSDIIYLSSLYERRRGRVTLLVMPFVALKYDTIERAKNLGLNVVQWSGSLTKESMAAADIVVLSVENLDSGRFRSQLTELIIGKLGHSLIARIFIDEAHTIVGHWDFRSSFQAISDLTCFSIPVVLLSATVPPSKVNDIRRVYNRPDLRLFRAPSTMRPNIKYEVRWVQSVSIEETLRESVVEFVSKATPADRGLVFCMSVATVENLFGRFALDIDGLYFYHGKLNADEKAAILTKWLTGRYKLLFCTSGFGVGIDYGDVRLVIHYDGIWNLLNFVQESGRAGRNQKAARSVVLLRKSWTPDYQRMPPNDAQEVDEYLNPDGYCRR
ncbi:P-loop containing nucleoside triphosphate hydrolase protein [Lipomyces kononenkoae]|uniref:P-loop containing nucleoside triphosphate hydrolase protein n=1 Tax=Lipomyces kononenkoae TaxID=34357 RepID=A0ACC3SQA9_LIPKO